GRFEPLARGGPELEVSVDVDGLVAFAIGNRQPAAGADRGEPATDLQSCLLHRIAHLREVLQIGAGPDVHVQPRNTETAMFGGLQATVELGVPDTVLRLFAP